MPRHGQASRWTRILRALARYAPLPVFSASMLVVWLLAGGEQFGMAFGILLTGYSLTFLWAWMLADKLRETRQERAEMLALVSNATAQVEEMARVIEQHPRRDVDEVRPLARRVRASLDQATGPMPVIDVTQRIVMPVGILTYTGSRVLGTEELHSVRAAFINSGTISREWKFTHGSGSWEGKP